MSRIAFLVNVRGVYEVDFGFMNGYEVGLLNCINCNPVPRGTSEPSSRGALKKRLHFRLTRGSS
jgi:hypothetical protein